MRGSVVDRANGRPRHGATGAPGLRPGPKGRGAGACRRLSVLAPAGRLALAGLAAAVLALVAPPVRALEGALAATLDRTIPERMAADGVPGLVVVVLRDGAPVWTRAFGVADPATGRPMTADALFRVESLSKPVTAWGAMHLAETGRLDLDAPVTACLERWRLPRGVPPPTPRQLLSHTGGIGLGDVAARFPPDAPRPALAEQLAAEFATVGAPGRAFAYSDTGYALLELAMEDCTGARFAGLMAREVLAPLGMERARFDWTGAEMPVGHDLRGRPVPAYLYPARASGGLHATAEDIARFAAAGMAGADQTVLSAEGIAALHRPVVAVGGLFGMVAEGYALGHFTETLSSGQAAVWHGGQGHGWMSHLHIVPATGDGIVLLSSSQRAWPLFAAILGAWSDSLGVAPVGMARVRHAADAAALAIAALLAAAAVSAVAALRGRPRHRAVRVAAGLCAAPALVWPLWAAGQDYLFLFSVLPRLWPWLAIASGLAGLGLAALALTPGRGR